MGDAIVRVLVVDDDPVQRRILRAGMVRAGYQVEEAADGQEALERVIAGGPRLVITDWMMPRLDGPNLIRCIREADQQAYTYIILLTARDGKADVVNGLHAGADDYLSKPFNVEELRARVAIGGRILDLEARLHAAMGRLEALALEDGLTGLLNRRAIMEHATAELARAQREGHNLGIVMIDVDHFKAVNDRHGHPIGDEVLKLVAQTLAAGKRGYDWAGRWGGEEFLLVLPGATADIACAVAERLRASVAGACLHGPDGSEIRVTISAGVCAIPPGGRFRFDVYLQQADEALYEAKRAGRDRVVVRAAPQDDGLPRPLAGPWQQRSSEQASL